MGQVDSAKAIIGGASTMLLDSRRQYKCTACVAILMEKLEEER